MNKRIKLLLFAVAIAATTIMTGGCGKSPQATVGNVSDTDITEHVKTALQQNDTLKGFDISVVTLKGDIRLIGVLNSQAQVDEAIKTARAAEGGHTIHDELTIRK